MLTPRLYLRRAARTLSRGGFTLVELLVVIGIIAILAGVALGPITNGIKKAKESAGVQESHAIGLAMYSAANDNSQLYPDSSGDASNTGQALLAGGYVTDPGIFYLSGDANSKKFNGSNAASNLAQSNVSWDFLSAGGSGASSVTATSMPLVWSTLADSVDTEPSGLSTTTPGTAVTAALVTGTTAPFGTDGVVVFYVNNSAAFVTSTLSGTTYNVSVVTSGNNSTGGGAGYTELKGK